MLSSQSLYYCFALFTIQYILVDTLSVKTCSGPTCRIWRTSRTTSTTRIIALDGSTRATSTFPANWVCPHGCWRMDTMTRANHKGHLSSPLTCFFLYNQWHNMNDTDSSLFFIIVFRFDTKTKSKASMAGTLTNHLKHFHRQNMVQWNNSRLLQSTFPNGRAQIRNASVINVKFHETLTRATQLSHQQVDSVWWHTLENIFGTKQFTLFEHNSLIKLGLNIVILLFCKKIKIIKNTHLDQFKRNQVSNVDTMWLSLKTFFS